MDNNKEFFNKHYSKLVKEGILKSAICGLIVGMSASFITAFIAYLLIRNGLVTSIVVGIAVSAAATVFFYFKRFKPSARSIAHRVDRLGLEERTITMLDLENDQSYIAMRQREDAKQQISNANTNNLKILLPLKPIVIAAAVFLVAVTMTIISVLSASSLVPWSPRAMGSGEGSYYEVVYEAQEGGQIVGEQVQVVLHGSDSTIVVPVADDGYVFEGWSDEFPKVERSDLTVTGDIHVFAKFAPMPTGEPGEGEEAGEEGMEVPIDLDKEGAAPAPSDPEKPGGDGAGGSDDPRNNIIDGETYYRELYAMYYQMALDALENNEELPPDLREIIEIYFGIII